MTLDENFHDLFKQIILTGSHSNNINTLTHKTSLKSIELIKKYVGQEPDLVIKDLKSLKDHIIDINIPLYLMVELNRMKIDFKELEKVFNAYIRDIFGLLKLAGILRFETDRKQIRGHLRKLIIKRLEKLNEDDIIKYFSEPEFKFKITLNKLIQITNTRFKKSNINIALQWLNKKYYNKALFKKHFPNLFYIDSLIHESNKTKAGNILKEYKGSYFPIRDFLSAIDEQLAITASQKIGNNELLERLTQCIPVAAYLAKKFLPYLLRSLPVAGLYISPVFLSVPVILVLGILLGRYALFGKKSKNIIFIDISGSNMEAFNSIIEDDSDRSYTLLDKLLASYTLIDPNYDNCDLYSFDDKTYGSYWREDIPTTSEKIIYFDECKLGDILTPFKNIAQWGKRYDNIFIFTNYAFSYNCLTSWETYLKTINPSARVFLVQHDPYNLKDIKLSERFYRIIGWNEKSIKCIRNIMEYC